MACETLYQKKNDDCATPKWLKDSLFRDWFDPCPLAIGGCFEIDGLNRPWKDRTYVNPPYSEPRKWVKKAIEENKKGKTIALLRKLDCSTNWFRDLIEAGAHIVLINERLGFNEGPKNACRLPTGKPHKSIRFTLEKKKEKLKKLHRKQFRAKKKLLNRNKESRKSRDRLL